MRRRPAAVARDKVLLLLHLFWTVAPFAVLKMYRQTGMKPLGVALAGALPTFRSWSQLWSLRDPETASGTHP